MWGWGDGGSREAEGMRRDQNMRRDADESQGPSGIAVWTAGGWMLIPRAESQALFEVQFVELSAVLNRDRGHRARSALRRIWVWRRRH